MDQTRPARRLLDWKPMGTRHSRKTKTAMARGCRGRFKKAENKKNLKETAKDRKTWRDLAEKVKTHKGL
jgi:hypothetical protein